MSNVRRLSAAAGGKRKGSIDHAADADLANMGYESKLPRTLSMLSILGLSFAIMAVPYGYSTTMLISLTNGQAVTLLWGWVLVSLISLCIAASLAEICAVYPTAGGKALLNIVLSEISANIFALYRCLLLVRPAIEQRMGTARKLGRRLAKPHRQLDGHFEHQLRRRTADPQRYLALGRSLRCQCVADGAHVLGCHACLLPGECFRCAIPGLNQQDVHLLDWGECAHHLCYAVCHGRQLSERRVRLRPL